MNHQEDLKPELPRELPFKVPAGYFESFPERLMQKISSGSEAQKKGRVIQLRPILFAAASILMILAGIFTFSYLQDRSAKIHNKRRSLPGKMQQCLLRLQMRCLWKLWWKNLTTRRNRARKKFMNTFWMKVWSWKTSFWKLIIETMKNFIFLGLLLLSGLLFAQPEGKMREGGARARIRTQRVAFITDKLALTAEESQKFWPVYHQFTDEWEGLKKAQNNARRNAADKLAFISDQDAEKMLAEEIQLQQRMVDLQRKYQIELKRVIPVKKIVMLYKAERDFKIELLRKLGSAAGKISESEEE
jgi:hypothetical protein